MTSSKKPSNLYQLLEIENDSEFLRLYSQDGVLPVWALVRVQFFRTIMSDLFYKYGSFAGSTLQRKYTKMVSYVARSQFHNFLHRDGFPSQICFFTTGLGNFRRNSQTYERLVGYFAECFPDNSVIYQDHGGWQWYKDYNFKSVLYATPFVVRSHLWGRLKVTSLHQELASEVIEIAVKNAQYRLGFSIGQQQEKLLKLSLARQLAILPIAIDYYANWLAKRNVRILIKEDACYGGVQSVSVIYAAKSAGITTAEFQHGAISKGHDGYNVAPMLANSVEFQRTLPSYLLTYGDWWGKQSNMPIKKVSVGNPHLTESLKNVRRTWGGRDKILILGDGIETQLYIDLAAKVAQACLSRKAIVVFRPHPLEREKVKGLRLPKGVELDQYDDIYSSLMNASVVVSELSTGLFEAVGLVDKILLWETEKSKFAFPELPFSSFSTIDELVSMLVNEEFNADHMSLNVPQEQLWKPAWDQNYKRFIESELSSRV